MNRSFAVLRTLIIAPLFVSIWTWFVPRWVIGAPLRVVHPEGWIPVVIGALIAGWCAFEFAWRGVGTPAPFDPPRRLVISGLYRYVRNPMYAGVAILLIGEAWLTARIEILYEMLIALVVVSIFVIAYEERALRSKFGDDYIEYCRNVRRWIPRLRPW
ncbi:MAG: isoprenylcysteine carboxylmethyltransferase family protein [Acidobacteriota bacterium]|nr:isoprenylcysteine carboxylmethyltransferase family protein [Acidobacteriota bacterium]